MIRLFIIIILRLKLSYFLQELSMMDWSTLLQNYGYFAIIMGAFFEGETVLLLGAYAVQQHILNFWLLIGAAMLGGFIGDQLYYQIGCKYGYDFIIRHPKLEKKFQKANRWIEDNPILSILLMRFAWGLRTVIPISFGINKYPRFRYLVVDILACFIWAFVVVSVGLQVTHWLHKFWQSLIYDGKSPVIVIVTVITCIVLIRIVYGCISHTKNKTKL